MKAFKILKNRLVSAPVITTSDWGQEFELMCDASNYVVGTVLGQRKGRVFHAIYYATKVLNDAQVNYATTEKEMLAIVYALEKFRSYLVVVVFGVNGVAFWSAHFVTKFFLWNNLYVSKFFFWNGLSISKKTFRNELSISKKGF